LTACGGADNGKATAGAGELPQGSEPEELDPFTADVDNRYWPMEPGTRWTYREVDEEGKELVVLASFSGSPGEAGGKSS
jgi:hypothetical protein